MDKPKISSMKALLESIRLKAIKRRLKAAFKNTKPATQPQNNHE